MHTKAELCVCLSLSISARALALVADSFGVVPAGDLRVRNVELTRELRACRLPTASSSTRTPYLPRHLRLPPHRRQVRRKTNVFPRLPVARHGPLPAELRRRLQTLKPQPKPRPPFPVRTDQDRNLSSHLQLPSRLQHRPPPKAHPLPRRRLAALPDLTIDLSLTSATALRPCHRERRRPRNGFQSMCRRLHNSHWPPSKLTDVAVPPGIQAGGGRRRWSGKELPHNPTHPKSLRRRIRPYNRRSALPTPSPTACQWLDR